MANIHDYYLEAIMPEVTPAVTVVYLTLSQLADKDGWLIAGTHELASTCKLSRMTLYRALKELEKHGAIRKHTRNAKCGTSLKSVYQIVDHEAEEGVEDVA